MHVYSNMRSLLKSEGCFLRTSIVVSNSFIHLYTHIRICLYVTWTELVGPLRYSLIRSYWYSQTGHSTQNRSVLAYYNKQLLPSWAGTSLWNPVSLRIRWWVTYHISPSMYGAFSVSACLYDWRDSMVLSYLSPLIVPVSLSLPSFRCMNRQPSETVHNQKVAGTLCILYNDSMADNIILIIVCISLLLVSLGLDNGSIERASQRWCVILCSCLKSITHSNRGITSYGMALYSWLERMYVRYITDQSCLYMCIEFLLYEQGGA